MKENGERGIQIISNAGGKSYPGEKTGFNFADSGEHPIKNIGKNIRKTMGSKEDYICVNICGYIE